MKRISLLSIILFATLASGCAGKHVYNSEGGCITCFNNPISGEPINHDGAANVHRAEKAAQAEQSTSTKNSKNKPQFHKEFKVSFSVPVNVDVAFIKIKRDFNFYSDQEIKQEWGNLAETKFKSKDYKWEAIPGVYYRARSLREHESDQMVIDITVEKNAADKSVVSITYWPRDPNLVNQKDLNKSLERRIKKTMSTS